MKKFLKYIAIIFVVFAADFLSKKYLLDLLSAKYGESILNPDIICAKCNINGVIASWNDIIGGDYGLSNLFNIHFIWNKGVSFSAFNSVMPIVLSIATALIIVWLIYYLFKRAISYERLPIAMIVGGALGNLVDRIRFGAVADFIQWHIGGLWTFPAIFNVGDMFITFGVILYLINVFINRKKIKSKD
nr:signal peptidase II [Candidatus Enterousia merdequi]